MPVRKKNQETEIAIPQIQKGQFDVCLLGVTPFYCNRLAEKARQQLLLPRAGRLTAADKMANLKHDPEAEFRSSPYQRRGDGPTRIMMVGHALVKAMARAAIDMPSGVAGSQIARLTSITTEYIPIWGIPRLNMSVVRSADIARTPDIRTRARIDHWASRVTVQYVKPMLNEQKVLTLFAAASILCGIGDWRQEKGGGSNGLWEIVAEDDPRYLAIIEEGGMAAQDAALANPVCSDAESEDLLQWYKAEIMRRGNEEPTPKKAGGRGRRTNGAADHVPADAAGEGAEAVN